MVPYYREYYFSQEQVVGIPYTYHYHQTTPHYRNTKSFLAEVRLRQLSLKVRIPYRGLCARIPQRDDGVFAIVVVALSMFF